MALRGFENDNCSMPGRSFCHERKYTISKVVRSGGWIRQELASHEIPVDTGNWQGRPGQEVATELLQQVYGAIVDAGDQRAAERIQQLTQYARILGCSLVPDPIELPS